MPFKGSFSFILILSCKSARPWNSIDNVFCIPWLDLDQIYIINFLKAQYFNLMQYKDTFDS